MKNNKYYIVTQDLFLCDADGQLQVLAEDEFSGLGLQVISSHAFYSDKHADHVVIEIQSEGSNPVIGNYQWRSLRSQLGLLAEFDFQLAGRALQILRWHYDHQYCGRCGAPTQKHLRDLARHCPTCSLDFYPRLSPCIITLVTRGDYCLLALHSRSKTRRYSCLAGFIEPGETPEETLIREVQEEVAINVKDVRYHSSQAWPFPGQLMLGYFAEFDSGEIQVDREEIIEADWFRFDQLPEVPPPATISGRLIEEFVRQCKS